MYFKARGCCLKIVIGILLTMLTLSGAVDDGREAMKTSWNCIGGNSGHNNYIQTDYDLDLENAEVIWKLENKNIYEVVSDGESLFIIYDKPPFFYDAKIESLDIATGETNWRWNAKERYNGWSIYRMSTFNGKLYYSGNECLYYFSTTDGTISWQIKRPYINDVYTVFYAPNYMHVDDRRRVICNSCPYITSIDEDTGDWIWTSEATSVECISSAVVHENRIFTASGCYMNPLTSAGKVINTQPVRSKLESVQPVVCGDYVVMPDCDGLIRYDSKTGDIVSNYSFKGRGYIWNSGYQFALTEDCVFAKGVFYSSDDSINADSNIICISHDNEIKWCYNHLYEHHPYWNCPVVIGNSVYLFGKEVEFTEGTEDTTVTPHITKLSLETRAELAHIALPESYGYDFKKVPCILHRLYASGYLFVLIDIGEDDVLYCIGVPEK
jgi:hypothetical protein